LQNNERQETARDSKQLDEAQKIVQKSLPKFVPALFRRSRGRSSAKLRLPANLSRTRGKSRQPGIVNKVLHPNKKGRSEITKRPLLNLGSRGYFSSRPFFMSSFLAFSHRVSPCSLLAGPRRPPPATRCTLVYECLALESRKFAPFRINGEG